MLNRTPQVETTPGVNKPKSLVRPGDKHSEKHQMEEFLHWDNVPSLSLLYRASELIIRDQSDIEKRSAAYQKARQYQVYLTREIELASRIKNGNPK